MRLARAALALDLAAPAMAAGIDASRLDETAPALTPALPS